MPFSLPADSPVPNAPLLPMAERLCEATRRIAVAFALLAGGSNLVVWMIGAMPVIAGLPPLMVMRLNTALGMTGAALSLACWHPAPANWQRRFAQALALLPLLIGTLTTLQDLAQVNFGIDELFGSGTLSGDAAAGLVRHPGRMSLNAALSLMFLGAALVLMDGSVAVRRWRFYFAPTLAMLAALPVALGLVGYLLGIQRFTGILRSTYILLHAAIALALLALGVMAARPDRPPMRRILSTGADGVLLRWMLPGSAALLLGLGWLIAHGREIGLVAQGEGTALMLYGGLILLFALLFGASRAVARQETQARRAALALRAGEERSRAILDTALDAVLLMDSAGLIVDWNPAAERIFGWTRSEVIGLPLAEKIIPPELRAAHYRGLVHLKATGEGLVIGKRLELPGLRRDGTQFPIELSVNSLPGAERALFVGFIRDITERQAASEKLHAAKEAAESASRAKDNFVAALSHELRTPLAPVLLSAAVLRDDDRLPMDVRAEMAMMERNVMLEARLIDDLLDLTRISRGKLPLRSEPCEAHSLLSHAVDIIRDDAQAKSIALELDLAAQHSGLAGDPARLQQVFWNLLKNAVKFTPAGGRIAIRTRDDDAAHRLIVAVSDTGLGFAPEFAERIFQPFEQAGREGDHRLGGLGLGLAIARAIVDLHGGAIRAESAGAGLGSTFTVELPGAAAPPPGMLTRDAHEPADATPTSARRILFVEDHEATLGILSRLLRRAGHSVNVARTVADALLVAAHEPFDLLISDLGLPDGTGVELILALRERHPQFQSIAVSGYGMEEDLARTHDAGFDAHLVKPIDFDQLQRTLRKLGGGA